MRFALRAAACLMKEMALSVVARALRRNVACCYTQGRSHFDIVAMRKAVAWSECSDRTGASRAQLPRASAAAPTMRRKLITVSTTLTMLPK
jgi:hypothetical protein